MISILRGRSQYALYSLLSLYSSYLIAQIDCSTLDNSSDQKVCRDVLSDSYTPYSDARASAWLDSVQKITADTTITQELLANTNRLYIFDHQTVNGERAVYHFPATIILPANSVMISNGTTESKPQFLLAESDTGSQFAATHPGYNAVVNVEIKSQTNEMVHELFLASGSTGVTLSGVTLSADYTPAETDATSIFNLLTLGYSSHTPTDFRIEDCDFLLPEIEPQNHPVVLTGLNIQAAPSGSSNNSTMFVTYKGNRLVSKDYNQDASNMINATCFTVSGLVRLSGSRCNSMVDWQSNSLLSDNNYQHWIAGINTPINNQALGFRNGKGWGWRHENGQTSYIYTTWDEWNQHGLNISCNEPTQPPLVPAANSSATGSSGSSTDNSTANPSEDHSSGDNLAAKVAVPVVVFAVVVGVTLISIVGGHKLRKRWSAERIQRALSDSAEQLYR